METTKLYVEPILIGLQSSIGILFVIINILGLEVSEKIFELLNKPPIVLVLLGGFYIIGLIVDRFADLIFEKTEIVIKKKSHLEVESTTMQLPFNNNQHEFMVFCRNRIRILRATIVNSIFIMISALWFILIYVNNSKCGCILAVLIFGIFTIGVSYKSLCKLLDKTFKRARVFELTLKTTVTAKETVILENEHCKK